MSLIFLKIYNNCGLQVPLVYKAPKLEYIMLNEKKEILRSTVVNKTSKEWGLPQQ
jgi:hypothetical protein